MRLPQALAAAIEEQVSGYDSAALARAAEELSLQYRSQARSHKPITSDLHRAAYLATRVPATYAAARSVFEETQKRLGCTIHSLVDLGAGPATAAWAAMETFPAIQQITLVERDPGFIRFGQAMAARSEQPALRNAEWLQADLRSMPDLPPRDLVVLSYSLGELANAPQLLQTTWRAARIALAVIEPGTPRGFTTILRARGQLLAAGAHIAAPCPHQAECPMGGIAGEWCHFAARLERSRQQQQAKSASMGYEDEKFSYMVAARGETTRVPSRIVRHPVQHKGHIELELCTSTGLERRVVTRSNREAFRRARKARWGSAWE